MVQSTLPRREQEWRGWERPGKAPWKRWCIRETYGESRIQPKKGAGVRLGVKAGTKEFLHLEEAASSRVRKPETAGASLKTLMQTSSQLRGMWHWESHSPQEVSWPDDFLSYSATAPPPPPVSSAIVSPYFFSGILCPRLLVLCRHS